MRASNFCLVLLVVATMSTACTNRTILHGHNSTKRPSHATAAAKKKGLSVWFVKPDEGEPKVVAVTRSVVNNDPVRAAVEELLEGPSAREEHDGLGTEIPRGTILLGVEREGNDVELNLSRRFATGGGATSFETRLDQLRKTVADVAGSANVYLSVEGKRLNISEGEGIEIHQPINR